MSAPNFSVARMLLLPSFFGAVASGPVTLLSGVMKCYVDIRKEQYDDVVLSCDTTRFSNDP